MTEIYLIRHGQAEGNIMRRFHGHYNTELTPVGYAQTQLLKKRFENIPIDACYASDLTRASLTARSVYIPKRLPLIRDSRFREVGIGVWEDLPCGYLNRYYPESFRLFDSDPPVWHVRGAETFDDYTQRFIEGLKEAAENWDGGTIAIFCHAAIIRRVLMRLFFWNEREKLSFSDNTSVTRLFYGQGAFICDFMNDISHLPENMTTAYVQKWWRESGKRSEIDLYYLPYTTGMNLPAGLNMPDIDSRGRTLVAMLQDVPVGVISMAAPEGDTGRMIGMSLREDLEGRHYGDQMLGAVFSHFRLLGCKKLVSTAGAYPDDILRRYAFDPETLCRNIDANAFDWSEPHA